MTDVNIHLVGHAEGELDRRGLVDLGAHHAPVLVVDGKAVLGTPLRNLRGTDGTGSAPRASDNTRGFVSHVTVPPTSASPVGRTT